MASFGRVISRTMRSGGDLTATQYHVLRQSAANTTLVASNPGGGSNDVIGVQQNKPDSGQSITIGYFGETKVVGGGTVTAGLLQATNGSGRVIDATSGDLVVGQALETATTDGEVIRLLLRTPAVHLPTSLNT